MCDLGSIVLDINDTDVIDLVLSLISDNFLPDG